MSIKEFLDDFIELKENLYDHGVNEKFLMLRKMSVLQLKCYQVQLDLLDLRASCGDPADVLKASLAFSIDDRRNLKKAVTINRHIGKRLTELRKVSRL